MSSPSLPPGYSPPSTVITESDHGGWITITIGVMLCNVLLFLAARLYIRFCMSPPFRRDDTVYCLATALVVIQSAVVVLQISKGFGKSAELIRPEDLEKVQKLGYTSDILYLVDLFLSKCCVSLLLVCLTPNKSQVQFFRAVLALTTLWILLSVFLVALRCDLSQPWIQYHVHCSGLSARWIFITTLNVLIETSLFLGSVLLIVKLKMAMQKKAIVAMVFGCRLPLIAITILRLHYLTISFGSSNPTLIGVPAVLLAQVELGWSIISATIPCLNPFMRAVSTNYGAMDSETIMDGSHLSDANQASGAGVGGRSYGLRSILMKRNPRPNSNHPAKFTNSVTPSDSHEPLRELSVICAGAKNRDSDTLILPVYHGDRTRNTAHVFSEGRMDADSLGGDSNGSTKMIIKKEVQWVVETDKNTVAFNNIDVGVDAPTDQITRENTGR